MPFSTSWRKTHDDVIKWKHFLRNWPFVRGIHRSPVNSPHKGQWRGALMFSWICVWINDWVNNREAGDVRRYRAHYDVIVMRSPLASTITVELIGRTGGRIFVRKIHFTRFVAAGNHWRNPARCLRLIPEHHHWHRMFSHLVKHKNCIRHCWSHLTFAEEPDRPLQLRAQNCFRTQNCLFNIYMMIIHRLLYGLHS